MSTTSTPAVPRERTVADVMSTPVVTALPAETVAVAAQRMSDGKVGSVVVIDHDDRAIGILTGRGVSGDEALRMGLANRLTEPGGALDAARVLAHELAALPPRCLREDRLSSYEQWGASLDEAMRIELRHARATLASGEALEGAIRFSEGAGRHGAPA